MLKISSDDKPVRIAQVSDILDEVVCVSALSKRCHFEAKFFDLLYDLFQVHNKQTQLISWAARNEIEKGDVSSGPRKDSVLTGLLSMALTAPKQRKNLQEFILDPFLQRLANSTLAEDDVTAVLKHIEDLFQSLKSNRHLTSLRLRQAQHVISMEWKGVLGETETRKVMDRWSLALYVNLFDDMEEACLLEKEEKSKIFSKLSFQKTMDFVMLYLNKVVDGSQFEDTFAHHALLNDALVQSRAWSQDVETEDDIKELNQILAANYLPSEKDITRKTQILQDYFNQLSPQLLYEVDLDMRFHWEVQRAENAFSSEEGWKLATEKDGITVWVPITPDEGVPPIFRVRMTVNTSMEDMIARVRDDRIFENLYRIKMEIAEQFDEEHIIIRSLVHMFPFKTREMLWSRRHVIHQDRAIFISRSTTHPSFPIRKKYVRTVRNTTIVMERCGEAQTDLMHIIQFSVGGNVPAFIIPGADGLVRDAKNIRKIVKKPKKKPSYHF